MNIARLSLLTAITITAALTISSCGDKDKKKADSADTAELESKAPTITVEPGAYTDPRDGKTYKTVKIHTQVWMAENLNFKAGEGSYCYDDNESNCRKYGRLYDWNTAVKEACPAGWHLPSKEEWGGLIKAEGGGVLGKKLKSKSGWSDFKGESGSGTDDYGFSALPGGLRARGEGSFSDIGSHGFWWSATEAGDGGAHYLTMEYGIESVEGRGSTKGDGFSVRCIQDDAAYKASAPPPAPKVPMLPPPIVGKFDAPNPFNSDVFFQFMAYVEDKGTPWAEFKYSETFSASSTREPVKEYRASALENNKHRAGGSKYGAWCEGVDGHGVGERVNMRVDVAANEKERAPQIYFKSLMLVNGVHGEGATWKDNSRVKGLRLHVGGKPWCDLQLKDIEEPQIYHFPENLRIYPTKSGQLADARYDDTYRLELSFEILDVYPGNGGQDHTCITGIALDAGM